jgi:hypothetical protein
MKVFGLIASVLRDGEINAAYGVILMLDFASS